jgi:membrane fusion protein
MPAAAPLPQDPAQGSAPPDAPLFRPEVMAARRTQWLGAVLLEPRLSSTVFVLGALLAALALGALVAFGSFTRKARVNGWLVPEQGVARIVAPQPGVVTAVHVREGARVAKGAPLAALSGEVQSEALGATREEVVRRLAARRDSLVMDLELQRRLFEQQAADAARRLALLERESRFFAQEIEAGRTQAQISADAFTRDRMRGADFASASRATSARRGQLEQDARLHGLQRGRAAHQREVAELQTALHSLPLRRQTQLAATERALAAVEQELAEAEARRQIVVTAPHDGTVTGIQIEPGGNAAPNVPLMTIVPSDTTLQAHLFSPSRAVGFVRPGQRVLLRYQAFPYQKFGLAEGTVVSVSRTAVSPAELGQRLAGLTSLLGSGEPVYRITVALARQTVTAYGEPVALQAGMQLEADVMMETRRLYEWVLDPLYSLTGKLR